MNITSKRKIIGTSSTSSEIEKLDEDQIEEIQLLEHQTCICIHSSFHVVLYIMKLVFYQFVFISICMSNKM